MSDLGDFWSELRRRRVVRTAIVYAAVAWVCIEVVSVLQPALHLPDSVLTWVVIAALVGFPVVLAMEWLYERASWGFRRTESDSTGARVGLPQLVAAFVVVLSIVGVASWRLADRLSNRAAEDVPLTREIVAVLPFASSGSPELEYLSHGLVDLLSTKLAGAENLRPLNSRDVLSYIARENVNLDAAGAARGVATRFGAGSLVRGSYVEAGGRLHISAALVPTDADSATVAARTASVEGAVDDLFGLVDRLAAQILASSGLHASSRLTPVAALTTDSLRALKAYLRGEATYRQGKYAESLPAYTEATEIDTTFALAYFRLAMAASWAERGDIREPALEKAYGLRTRLSAQDRRLVEAEYAYRNGRHIEAERIFVDIVTQNPGDAEAWYQLGEVRMHDGPLFGVDPATAIEAFRRAVALDPYNFTALIHLNHFAAVENRAEEMTVLTDSILAMNPDERHVGQLHALAVGSEADRAAALTEIAENRSGVVPVFISFAGWFVADPETAVRIGEAMTRPTFPQEWALVGHLMQASARATEGRWSAARTALDAAATVDRAHALEYRAFLALTAPEPLVAAELDSLRRVLLAWDGKGREPAGATPSFTEPHAGLHPQMRLYLRGLVEGRLGNAVAAGAAADSLDRQRVPEQFTDLVRDFAAIVRAEAARGAGDPQRALAELERASLWSVYALDGRRSPILGHLYPVFLRAELLRETGQMRGALRWYKSILLPLNVAPYTLARYRSAQILYSLGETGEARALFEAVGEAWSRADAPVREMMAGSGIAR